MKSKIKGGEFLVKTVKSDDIFITQEFTEEQNMMKEAVQDFINRDVCSGYLTNQSRSAPVSKNKG